MHLKNFYIRLHKKKIMKLLEINKAYGVNDTPNDVRHYEQEVCEYYQNEIIYHMLNTYFEMASLSPKQVSEGKKNPLKVYHYSSDEMCTFSGTRDQPREYVTEYTYTTDVVQSFETESFTLEFCLEGEFCEDRRIDTVTVENITIDFCDKSIDIYDTKIKELILQYINLGE